MTTLYRTSGGSLLMSGSSFRLCCCGDPPTYITCAGRSFILPATMTANFPSVANKVGCSTCAPKGGSQILALSTPSPLTIPCGAGFCCAFTWTKFVPPSPSQIYGVTIFIPTDGVSNIIVAATLNSECGNGPSWRIASLPWQSNFTAFSASLPYNGGTDCDGVIGTNVSVSA